MGGLISNFRILNFELGDEVSNQFDATNASNGHEERSYVVSSLAAIYAGDVCVARTVIAKR